MTNFSLNLQKKYKKHHFTSKHIGRKSGSKKHEKSKKIQPSSSHHSSKTASKLPKGEKVKAEKSKKVSPYSKKQHKKKEEVLKNLDLHKDEKQKLHKNGKSKVNSILKTAPHSDRVVGAFQNSEERLVIPKVKFASISNGLKTHSFFAGFRKYL